MVSRYEHKLGVHCVSTQISDILNRQGLQVEEELCFGIGAGLGFVYDEAFDPPLYFVQGRADDLEEKACFNLGGHAVPYTTDDPALAWESVKRLIDNDEPVIIDVDATYLPYLKRRFRLFGDVGYGGHRITVIGYDDSADTVLLSDYLWREAQEVPAKSLMLARGSPAGKMPPGNLFYSFLFPRKFRSLSDAIRRGIRMNVATMMHPWSDSMGLPALKRFTARVLDWPRLMSPDILAKNARMAFIMLEVFGTGGGNFRRLYARFLHEAMNYIGGPHLEAAFQAYAQSSDLWKELSLGMKEAAEDPTRGFFAAAGARSLLDAILTAEVKGIGELGEIAAETRLSS
jgi:hypothetical protein